MRVSFSENDLLVAIKESSASEWSVRYNTELDSTMNLARRMVEMEPESLPSLIIAAAQSGGRGQKGRSWNSQPGGFYATLVVEIERKVEALEGFSLAVGVIIAQTLKSFNVRAYLKWPNDLLDEDGKKLAGILIESIPSKNGVYALIGIGINFDNPIDIKCMASIRTLGNQTLSIPEWSAALLSSITTGIKRFEEKGFSSFLTAYEKLDYLKERTVTVDRGENQLEGSVLGVNNKGALIIATSYGNEEVWSGQITAIA